MGQSVDSYDGRKLGSWMDCPWVPKVIRNRVTVKNIEALNRLAEALMAQHEGIDGYATFEGKPLTEEQREQLKRRGF